METNERAMRDDHIDAHMERYITNRNTRTGETWRVIERYATDGNGIRCAVNAPYAWHSRAVVENERGERVRIWYRDNHWEIA